MEWRQNLDSWKSRRRKMSEDIFRRQEEIKQFETEEKSPQAAGSKKIKTFSEMVESRAHRGRTMSLCLISSPLELQQWEKDNHGRESLFSEESEENSAANSDEEGANSKTLEKTTNGSSNGQAQSILNGSAKNRINKSFELGENGSPLRDGLYVDSGLESISSSHRTGDTPDSCSDFSQDSGSSIDCGSPRASGLLHGVNLLEDCNSKSLHLSDCNNSFSNMNVSTSNISKRQAQLNGDCLPIKNENNLKKNINVLNENYMDTDLFPRNKENSTESSISELSTDDALESSNRNGKHESSVESENEVFVDNFDVLSKDSCSRKNENLVEVSSDINEEPSAVVASLDIDTKIIPKSSDTVKPVDAKLADNGLNVVFQSPSTDCAQIPSSASSSKTKSPRVTLTDVLPVELIAEEMEKLILQQLEEEECIKELSCKISTTTFDITPSKKVEPPKEKPPPPPNSEQGNQVQSLKRINSTKRIKKEIYKRRSNFLGIENADENFLCDDSLVPPPNTLEKMLKAEMELDRESMKKLENAAAERLKLEEKEIIRKEQEIIASIENEEFYKHLANNKDLEENTTDEDRVRKLKEERKIAETESVLVETQVQRLEEEKQLKEREEYIRKQEDVKKSSDFSSPQPSEVSNANSLASSFCGGLVPNIVLSETGDGNTVSISASQVLDSNAEKLAAPLKPVIPPKPLKKKEVIRKERERLRQEQEALQKEREEHRLRLLKEQELLKDSRKPNAPACKAVPPPPAKPSCTSKLTSNPQPSARENVVFSSQSYHGAQNGISSRKCYVDSSVISKHKPVHAQKKKSHNDSPVHQKVPLSKRTSHETSPESKYNQNHWLIQEAEMRRIAELKERQHSAQLADETFVGKQKLPAIPRKDKLLIYAQPGSVMQKPFPSETALGFYQHMPQPPAKPSRLVPSDRPEHILSISGRKRCSHCNEELGRGAAMIIESLQLYYHIHCFQCCVCQVQLGNGSCGTDVRVRNNKLHCQNCYSNDEAGLKFSQV